MSFLKAYLHARSAAGLSVSWEAGTLRVEVADDSAATPGRVDAGSDATSGRGMLITDALAGWWGARLAGVGKVVWFEVGPVSRGRVGPTSVPAAMSDDLLAARAGGAAVLGGGAASRSGRGGLEGGRGRRAG